MFSAKFGLKCVVKLDMSKKKKVLIVNNPLQFGGSDLVAVRLQQNLDKDKFECTYCLHHGEETGPYEPYVASTGVRIIHQTENKNGYIDSYKYFLDLFSKEHFDIVHCHLPFFGAIVMAAAEKCGVEKRVCHSHFSQPLTYSHSKIKAVISDVYRAFMRRAVTRYSTDIIGCTEEAGEYLAGRKGFSKKGIVLDNGIETDEYLFSFQRKSKIQKQLGIEGKTVIGHIGQMYYVKNHSFLIDVFNEFQKKNENSVLLLISDGPDREKIQNRVNSLGLTDKVEFLGFRNDIPELLSAMDCFVFPSIHEGFPLTLIEAQAAKLPCVVSDSVTKDAELSTALSFVSLNDDVQKWCSEIEKMISFNRNDVDNSEVIEKFDIKNIAKMLEKIYLN